MVFGTGDLVYELVPDWGRNNPYVRDLAVVPGICADSQDRIYLLSRSDPPVVVLSRDGTYLSCWGSGDITRPHGICPCCDGSFLVVDDRGHAVHRFTAAHRAVLQIGTKGIPSDTGCENRDYKTIRRAAGPFNLPTNAAVAPDGDFYVTDGYGNCRVHCFDASGNLKFSYGTPGGESGQFRLPHGVAVGPDDRVYVCDRENNRVQVFDRGGRYICQWGDLVRPADIHITQDGRVYLAECKRCSVFNGAPSKVTIRNLDGSLLAELDGAQPYDPAIGHHATHGVCVDSEGSIYVAESGRNSPAGYFGVQKYRRI